MYLPLVVQSNISELLLVCSNCFQHSFRWDPWWKLHELVCWKYGIIQNTKPQIWTQSSKVLKVLFHKWYSRWWCGPVSWSCCSSTGRKGSEEPGVEQAYIIGWILERHLLVVLWLYVITWTVNNYLWTGVHILYIFVVALPYLHKAKNVTVVVVQKRTFQFYGRGEGGHRWQWVPVTWFSSKKKPYKILG